MIRRDTVDYYFINETYCDLDTADKNRKILHENVTSTPGGKLYTITFEIPVTVFGKRNFNGRSYSRDVTLAMWNNKLVQNDLHGGPDGKSRLAGEAGHPNITKGMNELARQMTIDPKNISHIIDKYWEKGNVLMNQWTTVVGGQGDILRDRMLTGFPAMASTRSVGGVNSKGEVMPGALLVTVDAVVRPSESTAIAVKETMKVNTFDIPAPAGNTMSESAVKINVTGEQLKDFLMSEAVSRDRINQICDTMKLDYDTIAINENAVTIERFGANEHTKVIMPLNKLVGANMAHLWS